MTCESCTAATKNPHHPIYEAKCAGCCARGLAKSLPYFASEKAKRLTSDYRDALTRVFGENWEAGHKAVREWATKLKEGTTC